VLREAALSRIFIDDIIRIAASESSNECIRQAPTAAFAHRRSQGGAKGAIPSPFLENVVILCFERRFSKQNSVIRLKSNTLPPTNFWAGYATAFANSGLELTFRQVFSADQRG